MSKTHLYAGITVLFLCCLLQPAINTGCSGTNKEVNQCIADLESENDLTRWQAIQRLKHLGPSAAIAAPALIETLADKHQQVYDDVPWALLTIGKDSIQPLKEALRSHPNQVIRERSAEVLGYFDDYSQDVLPALVDALRDEELDNICSDIARLGPAAVPQLTELPDTLKWDNWRVRAGILEALWLIARHHSVPSEIFRANQDDEYIQVRMAAAAGICSSRKSYSDTIPLIVEGLKHEDAEVRLKAVEYLTRPYAGYGGALPGLISALGDDDERVRTAASEALGGIGNKAIPELLGQLNSANADVRYLAISSIRIIDRDAPGGIAKLKKTLCDADEDVRYISAETLFELGCWEKVLVKPLVERIKNTERTPFSALRMLGFLGDKAESALPALYELAETTEDPLIKKDALSAVVRIEFELSG